MPRRALIIMSAVLACGLGCGGEAFARAERAPLTPLAKRCPHGQVASHGHCGAPIPFATYTGAGVKVSLTGSASDTALADTVAWPASEIYPYRRACGGPPLDGPVLFASPQYTSVMFDTTTDLVGSRFATNKVVLGGAQDVTGGVQSQQVRIIVHGTVDSLHTVTGTVQVMEQRGMGTGTPHIPIYTTCGSTFTFTAHGR